MLDGNKVMHVSAAEAFDKSRISGKRQHAVHIGAIREQGKNPDAITVSHGPEQFGYCGLPRGLVWRASRHRR